MAYIYNSVFDPLSYSEMTAPLKDYAAAYEKVEKDYNELSDNVAAMKYYISERDKEALENYNNYTSGLTSAVDDFSNGMNLSTRRNLHNLRQQYREQMLPIATAITAREKLIEDYATRKAQDYSYTAEVDPNELTLDDLIANPQANRSRGFNGQQLYTYVAHQAENLAKKILTDSTYASSLGGYYYKLNQTKGASIQDVLAVIRNDLSENGGNSQVAQALQQMVSTSLQSAVGDWEDSYVSDEEGNQYFNYYSSGVQKALPWIHAGLWGALGQDDENYISNPYAHAMASQDAAYDFYKEHKDDPIYQGMLEASGKRGRSGGSGGSEEDGSATSKAPMQQPAFLFDPGSGSGKGAPNMEEQGFRAILGSTVISDQTSAPPDFVTYDGGHNVVDNETLRSFVGDDGLFKGNIDNKSVAILDPLDWMESLYDSNLNLIPGSIKNLSSEHKAKLRILYNSMNSNAIESGDITEGQLIHLSGQLKGVKGEISLLKVNGTKGKYWIPVAQRPYTQSGRIIVE